MSLFNYIREDVAKYEHIVKTEFKNAQFYMYYEINGKLKHKKLPYRANKSQLQRVIEKIRKEIGYYELKDKRIKEGFYDYDNHAPAWFVPGENNERRKRNKISVFSSC